jgi:D-sedoheptulose 7-phosphate isomerase
MSAIRLALQEAREVLDLFLSGDGPEHVATAARLLTDCFQNGGKVISCGNGGSMADAIHFAEELSGRFRHDRPALPAIAISDPGHLTCTANDYGFEQVFSRFCEAMLQPGDVLLAISTSGHSANVLAAADVAHQKGAKVIALTGNQGGLLANKADIEIRVPHQGYADRIQEVHIKIIHTLIGETERLMGF